MICTDPLPGCIGLTSITGPVGRLIQAGEWLNGDGFGPWEHAIVVLEGGRLIEAAPKGARIRPLTDYQRREVLYVVPAGLTWQQRWDVCDAARTYEGVPYSFLDYAALAAHRLRLPVRGLRRYIASTGHLMCSQLVDRAYLDAGVRLFTDERWPGYVTPMDLFDLLARPRTSTGAPRPHPGAPHRGSR